MATHSSVLAWRIPGKGGAWWAAIYGVTQSHTRLKWLSSSSSWQEYLRRNGVAIIVNKRVQNSVLWCDLKTNRIISVHFHGKPFNITIIQVYALTTNAEEAEWFYEDLQHLLEVTPKDVLFIIGDWNAKVGSQETPGVTGKFGLGVRNEAGQRQ